MKSIHMIETGSYLPEKKITNEMIEKRLNLVPGYIQQRTGIETRYYAIEETVQEMAIQSVLSMQEKGVDLTQVDLIIVSTTTPEIAMPGIANEIQKALALQQGNCFDVLAGCNGFVNAFDIASSFLQTGRAKQALVVGVDRLSTIIDPNDIGTAIVLSDGAGAVLLEAVEEEKLYCSHIVSDYHKNEILVSSIGKYIQMEGKQVYKYAVTETVNTIEELFRKSACTKEDISYLVPHQSNQKIMQAIAKRLGIPLEKMIQNIQTVGNTFCASIPIALDEMKQKGKLIPNEKMVLLGYGGGLNTGAILLTL